jgi:hypothetical protein
MPVKKKARTGTAPKKGTSQSRPELAANVDDGNNNCSFSKWNTIVESYVLMNPDSTEHTLLDLPAEIWDNWLWHTDPQEAPTAELVLNQCQLLGLLICRYRAVKSNAVAKRVPFSNRFLNIVDKNICDMTLRELRDTLSNVTLQWAKVVQSTENSSLALEFLDMCFHRFGEFCWASWNELSTANPIADDVANIECICISDDCKHQQITFACIRNMLNTFLVLYRLLLWQTQSCAQTYSVACVNGIHDGSVTIEKHHMQASLDFFYKLAMFYDLVPAARLNYMHNFSGLYNCVSQPAYFHNPDYERRVQLPLVDIQSGTHDVHTLPSLMQMFPEIALLYEDDDLHSKLKLHSEKMFKNQSFVTDIWAWMVTAAKRIYLMKYNMHNKTHSVFYNSIQPNIIGLIQEFYLPWCKESSSTLSSSSTTLSSTAMTPQQAQDENQIMTYFKLHFKKKDT